MQTLKTHKGELTFIKVPEDAWDFNCGEHALHFKRPPNATGYSTIHYAQGFWQTYIEDVLDEESNYKILGEITKDNITFDVEEYVGYDIFGWFFETNEEEFFYLMRNQNINLPEDGYKY
jgi:hypothetical protein